MSTLIIELQVAPSAFGLKSVDFGCKIVHKGIHKSPFGLLQRVMHLLSITTWQEDSFGVLVTQVCRPTGRTTSEIGYPSKKAAADVDLPLLLQMYSWLAAEKDRAHMIYGLAPNACTNVSLLLCAKIDRRLL